MKNPTHIVYSAILISASLGLAACQDQVSVGEGLGDANQSVCAHGQFQSFANQQDNPQLLALNGGKALWYNMGGVGAGGSGPMGLMSAPESGAAPTRLAEMPNSATPVLDDTNVYWVRYHYDPSGEVEVSWSVMTVPQGGGAEKTLYTGKESFGFRGALLAVDGESFYFSHTDEPVPTSTRLFSVPRTGGPAKVLATFHGSAKDESNDAISAMLVDDANLYFSYQNQILSLPKGGGTPVTLAQGFLQVQDATHLFGWAGTGDVVSVAKSGGASTTLVTGFHDGSRLGADDVCVYFIDSDNYALMAAPKTGGQVVAAAVASNLTTVPSGVMADATGVYVSDHNGVVWKLPR